MTEKDKNKENSTAAELIANAETAATTASTPARAVKADAPKKENKVFSKFKIKDIVFLAIMSACTLVTGAIMPLVGQIPLFGIVQLCLGLQFSVFPVIGLMKVRKPGSLLFMALCCGVLLVFMNTVMFFCLLICAAIAEALALLFFRGYKKDRACLLAGTVYMPLTLPFLYVYYKFLYTFTGEEGQAVSAFIGAGAGAAIGISVAVVAVCFVGSVVGVKIARELKKAGVLKK